MPPALRGHFGIAQPVRLSVTWRSCLGYRHTGCLQLSHRWPPEMCGLQSRPQRHRSATIFAIVELRGGAYHLTAPGDTLFTQLNSFSLRKDNVQWLGRVADIMRLE